MALSDLARRALPGEPLARSQRFWCRISVATAVAAVAAAALAAFSPTASARDVPPPPTLEPSGQTVSTASQGPTRVGRVVLMSGRVAWWDDDQGQWVDAERNRALSSGDRIAAAQGAWAELRIGSTVVRLGGDRGPAELELARVEPERVLLHLHTGSVALRVRSREIAAETEVMTDEVRLVPVVSGHYRIDRIDDVTQAGAWRGMLRVVQQRPVDITAGQWAELWREDRDKQRDGRDGRDQRITTDRGDVRVSWGSMPDDAFASRVLAADGDEGRSASSRYVSPEMTGAEELDRHGRWDRHPEHGAVWFPLSVSVGWAPFRDGRWTWSVHWGWTWVDNAPWGFAPSHYGRWVWWRDRWGWCPGGYVARPVFAPAVVGWVGGPHWSVSVRVGGGPAVGWVPLAPWDRYVPWTPPPRRVVVVRPDVPPPWVKPLPNPRYGRQGEDRWESHRGPGNDGYGIRPPVQRVVQALPPPPVPSEPISYGHQGVPNAVTMVGRDALMRRETAAPQPAPASVFGPQRPVATGPVSTAPGVPVQAAERGWPREPLRGREQEPDREQGREQSREQAREQGREPSREQGRDQQREQGRDREAERGQDPRWRQRWEESGRGGLGASTRPAPAVQAAPQVAPPPTPAPTMQLPRATPMPSVAPPAAAPPAQAMGPRPPPPQAQRREPRERGSQDERARVPADVRHGGREREAAR